MADSGINKWQKQEINSNAFDLRSKAGTPVSRLLMRSDPRLLAATAGKLSGGNTRNTEEANPYGYKYQYIVRGKGIFPAHILCRFPNICLCSNIHQHDSFISSFS